MARNLANFDIMNEGGGSSSVGGMQKKKKYGLSPSFSQQDEKKTGAQAAGEGAERLGRFGGAMKKDTGESAVTKLQKYAMEEAERNKKKKAEEEAKKKKAKEGGVAPEKGFIERMMDKYWYKKE